MTNKDAKKCVEHIRYHMEGGECWTDAEFEAMDMAITALGAIEQIQWERDTAIKQLNDLGYQFGEEVVKCCNCTHWDRDTIEHRCFNQREWDWAECSLYTFPPHKISTYMRADDYCSYADRRS